MKKVLVLGAGLVSRPIVRDLLSRGIPVTVADQARERAEALVAGVPHGRATVVDADDDGALGALVRDADLVVSLLPYTRHVAVARHCLGFRRDLVTSSYVSPEMRALDGEAKAAGLLFLNECGLDPGLDHMSAMRVFARLRSEGATLVSFWSSTGGLPAPEAATNPWGYKFSWSPRGVLLAGRNAARFLENGAVVEVPGSELFDRVAPMEVPGLGAFEFYPNRDSLPYVDTYGIHGVRSMFRGTIRYRGWSAILREVGRIGLLGVEPRAWPPGTTWRDVMRALAPEATDSDPRFAALAWAGCFSDRAIGAPFAAPLDLLCALLEEKLGYAPGERDLIVMEHRFEATHAGSRRRVVSRLVAFGEPGGDSAMARTVTLPASIAVRLRLEGRLPLSGVHIPVVPEVYGPVLEEMERFGVRFEESETSP
jgi:saccharopine dehydrogenase-like NADP-dependent oxidoreductase